MRKWWGGQFDEISDPHVTVEMTGWPSGVCAGPDGRVALFYGEDDDTAIVVAFNPDGSMPGLLPLRPTGDRGEQDGSTEYRRDTYFDTRAVVWHDRLGLFLNQAGCSAFTIRPEPEALPQELPAAWWGLPTFNAPERGHRLSGGRALLIYDTFGIVVEP